jgi:hypothetical protein
LESVLYRKDIAILLDAIHVGIVAHLNGGSVHELVDVVLWEWVCSRRTELCLQ